MDHIGEGNLERYKKFRDANARVFPEQSPQRWINIKPTYDLLDSLRTDNSLHKDLLLKCNSLSDLERVNSKITKFSIEII